MHLSILVAVLLFCSSAFSQVTMGGSKGLLRVYDAETVYPGILYINPFYLGYFTEKTGGSAEDHNLNLSFTVGLSKLFEVFAHTVPYQDDQTHVWGPIGDTKLGLKFAVPNKGSIVKYGLVAFASFPTGVSHNVPYEPFSLDRYGWGLLGVMNIDLRNASATVPLKFSLNLGYRDHDWNDRYFADKKDQLLAGLGFKFPIRSSILYSEVTGELFINNTEEVPLSYNSIRFTQGIRFLGPWDLIVDFAADVDLSGYTIDGNNEVNESPFVKDYADWKVILGITYSTKLFTYLTPGEKLARKKQKEEQRKLESIRQQRQKVAKELEELRKNLEKEKRQKEPPN